MHCNGAPGKVNPLAWTRKLAEANGVTYIEHLNGHVQLKGKILVNYYPLAQKKTAYIVGESRGRYYTMPEQAVRLAMGLDRTNPGERRKRPPLTKHKTRLWNKGRICSICHSEIETFDEASVDHYIPRDRGGPDHPNNYRLAHRKCNSLKGNRLPGEL